MLQTILSRVTQIFAKSQYLVKLSSLRWSTDGQAIHRIIEGLLPPAGTEPKLFPNFAPKVAGLKVHVTGFLTVATKK